MHLLYLVSGLLWKVNLNCIHDKWASQQTASKLAKTGARTNHEKRLNCDGDMADCRLYNLTRVDGRQMRRQAGVYLILMAASVVTGDGDAMQSCWKCLYFKQGHM